MEYLLSIIVFFPLIAGIIAFSFEHTSIKVFGIVCVMIELILVSVLWYAFDMQNPTMQFENLLPIIPEFGVSYHIGVDGISLVLLLLNAIVIALSVFYVYTTHKPHHFIACLLVLESILMCVFSALNILLFYICWELSLLPILYMIGVWGSGDKIRALLKFFLYTFFASLIMFIGILCYGYLFFLQYHTFSFELLDWYNMPLPSQYQLVLFLSFFFAIAVKIPIIPFHAWLPHAYGNAPTLGSVALSALLLKMGTYALVRFMLPLFPDASYEASFWVLILALCMVIYGAWLAYAQKDFKQVIAYSSISHMGVVVLGIFSFELVGIGGAVFMMFAHGIVSAALFMLVGAFSARVQTRNIDTISGVARVAPIFCAVFGVVLMANVGLPLSIGFVGEFLSLLGIFKSYPVVALLGGTTIIFSAVYMLSLYKRLFFGALKVERSQYSTPSDSTESSKSGVLGFFDLTLRERIVMSIFVVLIIVFGVYPKPLLAPIDSSTKLILEVAQARAQNDTTRLAFGADSTYETNKEDGLDSTNNAPNTNEDIAESKESLHGGQI